MPASPIPLSSRHERFITEYLKDQNASAAARRAGYSTRSCARQGSRLLRRPEIGARLRTELQGAMAQSRASARELMEQRCKVAHFRTSAMFDADGRFLDFKQMDAQTFDCLRISVRLRKGEPEYFIRPPNQEAALRALERLNEVLEKQDERHFEREEKTRREAQAARAARPVRRPRKALPALDVERIEAAPVAEQAVEAEMPHAATPAPLAEVQPPLPKQAGAKSQACSPPPEMSGEKTRKHGHLWTSGAAKAKSALGGMLEAAKEMLTPQKVDKRKGPRTPEELKDPNYSFRDDPNWMWGGRVSQPDPEPEVLRREQAQEQIGALVCRGRVKPGAPRPPGVPANWNPPSRRDPRPRYAEGTEFEWSWNRER